MCGCACAQEVFHKCEVCAKTYRSAEDLLRHSRKHDLKRPALGEHDCDHCRAQFVSEAARAAHDEVHQRTKICDNCDARYATQAALSKHRQERHVHRCPLCHKTWEKLSDLNEHECDPQGAGLATAGSHHHSAEGHGKKQARSDDGEASTPKRERTAHGGKHKPAVPLPVALDVAQAWPVVKEETEESFLASLTAGKSWTHEAAREAEIKLKGGSAGGAEPRERASVVMQAEHRSSKGSAGAATAAAAAGSGAVKAVKVADRSKSSAEAAVTSAASAASAAAAAAAGSPASSKVAAKAAKEVKAVKEADRSKGCAAAAAVATAAGSPTRAKVAAKAVQEADRSKNSAAAAGSPAKGRATRECAPGSSPHAWWW